jgi:hypothetical protein
LLDFAGLDLLVHLVLQVKVLGFGRPSGMPVGYDFQSDGLGVPGDALGVFCHPDSRESTMPKAMEDLVSAAIE